MTISWSREAIEALGTRTDLKTAASVAGLGYTRAKELARTGSLPFPVHRIGAGSYIVPVAGLLQWLCLTGEAHPTPSEMDVAADPTPAATSSTSTGQDPGHDRDQVSHERSHRHLRDASG